MSNQTITFMMDKNGDRHDIDLNENVLATDVFEPEGKVVTDTVVKEGFDQFYQDKFSNTTDLYNMTTQAPTGRAVATYVTNQLTGEMGGFLGNKTHTQINAWGVEDLTKGDSVICTDGGSITLGGLTVLAGAELVFTAENVWVEKLTSYVRPENYATTSRGGTIKSSASSTSGDIVVDADTGIASVFGWDDKVDNSRSGLETLLTNAVDLGQGQSINDTDVLYTKNSATTYATKFTLSRFWDWIKDKIHEGLGLDEDEYDGNSATATEATSSYNLYAKDVNGVTSYILTDDNLARSDIYLFNDGVAPTDRFQCNASQLVITQSYHFHFPFGGTLRVNNNTGSSLKIRWNGEETVISNGSYYDFVANENGIVSLLHAWSNCILGASSINADKVDGYHIDVVTSGSISTETDHITFLKYTS